MSRMMRGEAGVRLADGSIVAMSRALVLKGCCHSFEGARWASAVVVSFEEEINLASAAEAVGNLCSVVEGGCCNSQ